MKKLFLILPVFLLTCTVFAQQFVTSTYVERTSVSPKTGVSIGTVNRYGMEFGGFYQESKLIESTLMSERSLEALPRMYEQVFYGAYFACPLLYSRISEVRLNIRTGVVNGESFVITPSVLGRYKFNQTLSVGAGVGVRAFRPTFQTKISITI